MALCINGVADGWPDKFLFRFGKHPSDTYAKLS